MVEVEGGSIESRSARRLPENPGRDRRFQARERTAPSWRWVAWEPLRDIGLAGRPDGRGASAIPARKLSPGGTWSQVRASAGAGRPETWHPDARALCPDESRHALVIKTSVNKRLPSVEPHSRTAIQLPGLAKSQDEG